LQESSTLIETLDREKKEANKKLEKAEKELKDTKEDAERNLERNRVIKSFF